LKTNHLATLVSVKVRHGQLQRRKSFPLLFERTADKRKQGCVKLRKKVRKQERKGGLNQLINSHGDGGKLEKERE
jgi:hypothetical protein